MVETLDSPQLYCAHAACWKPPPPSRRLRPVTGFPPLVPAAPRILILGSFPSARSLACGQYYGYERNQFWLLVAQAYGEKQPVGWDEKRAFLARNAIALWDVIASCERMGSRDDAIRAETPNPIATFVASFPGIERIALNGGKAAASFLALVAPELGRRPFALGETRIWQPASAPVSSERGILVRRLPSSSPIPTQTFRSAADKLPFWTEFLGPRDDKG